MRKVSLCFILLFCCGCTPLLRIFNPTAHSLLIVQGEILNVEPTAACDVRLFSKNGRLSSEHSISPEIRKGILVDPGRNEYYVEISCNGHPGKYRSNTLVMDDGRKTFDLGSITLIGK